MSVAACTVYQLNVKKWQPNAENQGDITCLIFEGMAFPKEHLSIVETQSNVQATTWLNLTSHKKISWLMSTREPSSVYWKMEAYCS